MRVLGIDISSVVTGWGVIENDDDLIGFGEIELKQYKKTKEPLKYMEVLYNEIRSLCRTYTPDKIYVEATYLRNVKTIKSLSRVRGIVELACLHEGIKFVTEVAPSHIRKVVLNKGNLESSEICTILEKKYNRPLATKGFDAVDGIMVALCGAKESK